MKSLTIRHDSAQVRDLNDMREFLEKAVLALGGSDDDAGDLVLAVNEAVTNVLLHGYDGQPGPVTICVEVVDNDLRVILSDNAPPFDPTRVPPPDIFLPLEDRPLGGLGVHMMRQLTDELLYRPLADGNELVFVKRGALARAEA
ncbi:MAG: ATP-binding protein [Candidatus Promineofilum sp.]|jgi:serine/threonine-protein kinase RsbW|nr:ATP-binding protein [Promineifilum sp.]